MKQIKPMCDVHVILEKKKYQNIGLVTCSIDLLIVRKSEQI